MISPVKSQKTLLIYPLVPSNVRETFIGHNNHRCSSVRNLTESSVIHSNIGINMHSGKDGCFIKNKINKLKHKMATSHEQNTNLFFFAYLVSKSLRKN